MADADGTDESCALPKQRQPRTAQTHVGILHSGKRLTNRIAFLRSR